MDRIVIDGIPPYDGEYPLDLSYFTNRELHTIKKVSGVRAGELLEAFAGGDQDVFVGFTVVAIQRKNGGEVDIDKLWDADAAKISFVGDTPEVEDTSPPEFAPVANGSSDGKPRSSGLTSDESLATPVSVPLLIGTPDSDTSAISVQEISAS